MHSCRMLTTFFSAPLTSLLTSVAGVVFGAGFLGGGLGAGLGAALGAGFFAGAAFFFVAAVGSAAGKKSDSWARAEGVRLRPGELALSASMDTGGGIRNLTDFPGEPFFPTGFFWIVFFGGGTGLAGGAFFAGATLTGAGFGRGAFLAGAFFGGGAAFFRGAFLGGGAGGVRFFGAGRGIECVHKVSDSRSMGLTRQAALKKKRPHQ